MVKRKVKALGAWLSIDPEETVIINYDEKLEIVRNTLSNWKYRRTLKAIWIKKYLEEEN